MGMPVRYLDVGGGLGVDYDGSRTSSSSSINYDLQEYAKGVKGHLRVLANTTALGEFLPPVLRA